MRRTLAVLTLILAASPAAAEPFSTDAFTTDAGWDPIQDARLVADVDGDGRADLIGVRAVGAVVALATETGWGTPTPWSTDFTVGALERVAAERFAGDVDGDGRTDLIGFAPDGVVVARSTGAGFEPMVQFEAGFEWTEGSYGDGPDSPRTVADVDGDGRVDLVGFAPDGVYVGLSTGDGFAAPVRWLADMARDHGWHMPHHVRRLADIDGDGAADLVGFGHGGVFVALSTGAGFAAPQFVLADFGYASGWRGWSHERALADVNGDGMADVVAFSDARVLTALADGQGGFIVTETLGYGFGPRDGWSLDRTPRRMADVTGDGLADLVAFGADRTVVRVSEGSRLVVPRPAPASPLTTTAFTSSDGWDHTRHLRRVGDVNGDGRVDLVGFHERGVLVSLSTGGGFTAPRKWSDDFVFDRAWRITANREVADVNGDGLADIVGFGNSDVAIALSTGDGFAPLEWHVTDFDYTPGSFGHGVMYPRMVADVDGDGRADLVGIAPDGIYVSTSTGDGFAPRAKWLDAMSTDHGWDSVHAERRLGDLNGDGMADLVGFGDDGIVIAYSNGQGFDLPVPEFAQFGHHTGGWRVWSHPRTVADFDGDGVAEVVGFANTGIYTVDHEDGEWVGYGRRFIGLGASTGWDVNGTPRFTGDVDGDGRDDVIAFGWEITTVVLAGEDRFAMPQMPRVPAGETHMSSLRAGHVDTCLWTPRSGGEGRQVRCGEGGWSGSWAVTAHVDGTATLRTPYGQCLRATGDAISSGACDAAARWHLQTRGEEWVLRPAHDGTSCLGVESASRQKNAPLRLQPCTESAHQRWRPEMLHDKVRAVSLQRGDECLVDMAPTFGACPGKTYELIDTGLGRDQLRDPESGLCWRNVGDGVMPALAECTLNADQLWRFEPANGALHLKAANWRDAETDCVYIPFGFGGFRYCFAVYVPPPPPVLWSVETVKVTQPSVWRLLRSPDGDEVALGIPAGPGIVIVSDPPMIVALLAGQGIELSEADEEALFGGPVEPAQKDDSAPVEYRRPLDGEEVWTAAGDDGPAHGSITIISVGGAAVADVDHAEYAAEIDIAEAKGSLRSDSGSEIGLGVSVGLGFRVGASWGEDDRYGVSIEIIAISLDLYVSGADMVTALLNLGRGIAWVAEHVWGFFIAVHDFGDSVGDWFEGAGGWFCDNLWCP